MNVSQSLLECYVQRDVKRYDQRYGKNYGESYVKRYGQRYDRRGQRYPGPADARRRRIVSLAKHPAAAAHVIGPTDLASLPADSCRRTLGGPHRSRRPRSAGPVSRHSLSRQARHRHAGGYTPPLFGLT